MKNLEVHEILSALERKYIECSTYADVGRVDFFAFDKNIELLEFKTRFVRPNYYRFECHDYGPGRGKSGEVFSLISNGYSTVFKGAGQTRPMESLQLGIASATGCSAGVGLITPALLIDWKKIPRTQGVFGSVLQLKEPVLLKQERLDDEECYVLRGELYGQKFIVWIAKRDFTLKRVFQDLLMKVPSRLEKQVGSEEFRIQLLERKKVLPVEFKDPEVVCWSSLFTFQQCTFDTQIEPDLFRHTLL